MRNLLTVLSAAGATQQDVAKLTIYLAAGQDVRAGFGASTEVWGAVPTAVTVVQVPSFARPEVQERLHELAA